MAKSARDAGGLHDLYGFESREPTDDGYGNVVSGAWTERFTTHAETTFLRGTEQVMAARLEGRQPALLRIRLSAQAKTLSTDWRAHDKRRDTYYAIRALMMTPDRGFVEILAEEGVST